MGAVGRIIGVRIGGLAYDGLSQFYDGWSIPGTFIVGPIVDHLIKSGANQIFSYKMSFLTAAILMFVGALILLFVIRMNRSTKEDRVI